MAPLLRRYGVEIRLRGLLDGRTQWDINRRAPQ
jgi:hypothetical protein